MCSSHDGGTALNFSLTDLSSKSWSLTAALLLAIPSSPFMLALAPAEVLAGQIPTPQGSGFVPVPAAQPPAYSPENSPGSSAQLPPAGPPQGANDAAPLTPPSIDAPPPMNGTQPAPQTITPQPRYAPPNAPTFTGNPNPLNAPATMVAPSNLDGLAPPPGTLGTTYKRRTRLVPDDKHPRIAIVDVWNVPESADITARGMKPRWYKNHWRLETETPLVPGIPHIYGIMVTENVNGETVTDVKWIRLIMGRIVDLDFDE